MVNFRKITEDNFDDVIRVSDCYAVQITTTQDISMTNWDSSLLVRFVMVT